MGWGPNWLNRARFGRLWSQLTVNSWNGFKTSKSDRRFPFHWQIVSIVPQFDEKLRLFLWFLPSFSQIRISKVSSAQNHKKYVFSKSRTFLSCVPKIFINIRKILFYTTNIWTVVICGGLRTDREGSTLGYGKVEAQGLWFGPFLNS